MLNKAGRGLDSPRLVIQTFIKQCCYNAGSAWYPQLCGSLALLLTNCPIRYIDPFCQLLLRQMLPSFGTLQYWSREFFSYCIPPFAVNEVSSALIIPICHYYFNNRLFEQQLYFNCKACFYYKHSFAHHCRILYFLAMHGIITSGEVKRKILF